jgi:tetratricopeptide (TPR) repeat protein
MKPQYLLVSILTFLAASSSPGLAQSSRNSSQKINLIASLTPSAIESTAKDISVQLSSDQGTGSGVLIGKEGNTYTILSAAHIICTTESNVQSCLEPASIELTTPDGEFYTASEVKEFPFLLDLVVIKFQSPFKYPVAKMGDSTQIKRGDQLFSSGFTKGDEWNFYEGKLIANSLKKLTSGGHDLLHNAKTIPGMSGGGIYNTKGELICINSQNEELLSTSSCVPITFYREFDPQIEKVASELYLLGKKEYYNRNYKKAIEYLSQAVAKDPTFAEAYFLRGECYYIQSNHKLAIKSYGKAIAINPNMVEAHMEQGKSHYHLSSYSSALTSFQKVSEIKPKDPLALQWQGLVLYEQEKYDQAIEILGRGATLDESSEYTYELLGKSYERNDQIEQALISYSRAIEIGGSDSDSLPIRAKIYLKNKSYAQAIQDYDLLLAKKYNSNKVEHYWSRSTALIELQKYSQALLDMDEIIKIDKDYKPAYLRQAQTYAAIEEYPLAIAYYNDFIERSTEKPVISTPSISPLDSSTLSVPGAASARRYYTDYTYDKSKAVAYRGRGLAYLQQKQYGNATIDLQIAAELYRQDNKLEEEQFCLNTLQYIPKAAKPKPTKNVPRRK